MARLDPDSSAYEDRLSLEALQLIDAATKGPDAIAAAYDSAWRSTRRYSDAGLDPINIAQKLAEWVAVLIQGNPDWRATLDRQLAELRLIVAAEIPDIDD